MAGIKISALPPVASALTTDFFPVVQGGITSRETLAQVQTLFGFSSGLLDLAHGGTNANLTANNGGIFYSTATAAAILAGVATAGKVLQSGATSAPTWSTPTYPSASGTAGKILISDGTNNIYSTPTYPNTSGTAGKILRSDGTNNVYSTSTFADTYAVSTILYGSSSNTVTGLATTNRAALSTNATGVPTWLALTDGQLVIGSTAGAPAAGTLSAGPGISIANTSNTITISGTGSGIGWTLVSGATQTMVADNGYVANNAGQLVFNLPATAAFGTALSVIGMGAGGWKINTGGGQNIQVGSSNAGTSVASTNRYDSIDLLCTVANTTWITHCAPQGNLTIV